MALTGGSKISELILKLTNINTIDKQKEMWLLSDAYKAKLINNILFAVSQEEVTQIIGEAIASLETIHSKSKTIISFAESVLADIHACNPMKKDAQQWSNITLSRVLLNRIRFHFTAEAV